MSATATLPGPLTEELTATIADLLLQGRRVSEVIATGLDRQPSWRRDHVIAVISEKGWALDSDGRLPRRFRPSPVVPMKPLPGAPIPAPPREPVAEWPERGAVTEGPRATPSITALLATGKAHDAPRVRRIAEKADAALRELKDALAAEDERDGLRRRLAQLEEEQRQIRAKLSGTQTKNTPTPRRTATAEPGGRPPIQHGTWGGFLAEKARGLDHCADCVRAKDDTMAARAAKRAAR